MKLAHDDLANRRQVWWALSDLFLDTELDEFVYKYIARTCCESPYSPDECEEIFWNEVYPVCIGNMLITAGVWTAFDKEWLEAAILRHVSSWRFCFRQRLFGKRPLFNSMLLEDWNKVQTVMQSMCGGKSNHDNTSSQRQ